MNNLTLEERFWSKVDRRGPDECWAWTAATNRKYGRFGWKGKNQHANRVAWELANGSIPDGLQVLHRCDNPPCCNPSHLFLGTQLDNIRDMTRKGRQSAPKGEDVGTSKLTAEQVSEIRASYARGGVRQSELASKFGVARSHIGNVISRRLWRHIP